jgi:uncharacterized protein YbjT (DUF2867 family)
MFALMGITGNVGGAVARTLLDAGRGVRAIVREPAKGAAWGATSSMVRKGNNAGIDQQLALIETMATALREKAIEQCRLPTRRLLATYRRLNISPLE